MAKSTAMRTASKISPIWQAADEEIGRWTNRLLTDHKSWCKRCNRIAPRTAEEALPCQCRMREQKSRHVNPAFAKSGKDCKQKFLHLFPHEFVCLNHLTDGLQLKFFEYCMNSTHCTWAQKYEMELSPFCCSHCKGLKPHTDILQAWLLPRSLHPAFSRLRTFVELSSSKWDNDTDYGLPFLGNSPYELYVHNSRLLSLCSSQIDTHSIQGNGSSLNSPHIHDYHVTASYSKIHTLDSGNNFPDPQLYKFHIPHNEIASSLSHRRRTCKFHRNILPCWHHISNNLEQPLAPCCKQNRWPASRRAAPAHDDPSGCSASSWTRCGSGDMWRPDRSTELESCNVSDNACTHARIWQSLDLSSALHALLLPWMRLCESSSF